MKNGKTLKSMAGTTYAPTDTELMDAVYRRNESALCMIIQKYRPLVFRTALRIVCRTEEAEDITQEVFIRIWDKAGSYNRKYSLATWLYRITSNLCIDSIRKRRWLSIFRSGEKGDTCIEETLPPEISAEERMIIMEDWKIFTEATCRLSPKQRTVFVLKELEMLDTGQISEITGMTPDQIKSNLYHARKSIKSMIYEKR